MVKFQWRLVFYGNAKQNSSHEQRFVYKEQKESLSFQIEIHGRIVWTPTKWVLSLITA